MWFFWIFGNNVEDRLGPVRFLTFYLTGGILATLFHYAAYPLSPIPVVGASGAISAVMGAYLITWPGAMIRCLVLIVFWLTVVSLPAWFFITLWFLGQILGVLGPDSGQLGGGVAWWAHIGGFISGIGLMYLLAPQDDRLSSRPISPTVFSVELNREFLRFLPVLFSVWTPAPMFVIHENSLA